MKRQTKMQIRDNYYYRYCCVYDNTTRKKKQYPVRLAKTSNPKLAITRMKEVESVLAQLKRSGIPTLSKTINLNGLAMKIKQVSKNL